MNDDTHGMNDQLRELLQKVWEQVEGPSEFIRDGIKVESMLDDSNPHHDYESMAPNDGSWVELEFSGDSVWAYDLDLEQCEFTDKDDDDEITDGFGDDE